MTPELIVTATPIAATLIYVSLCWIRPFGRCHACKGTGIRRTILLRKVTTCRRCKGSRLRLRVGRRVYNAFHNANTEAARTARAKNGGAS
ncbi:hypothetical protein [Catellatospora citrea]|uniref:Uncharacterized protein n=1 Tax=Catellatospora citrea TaxID=53366 RepID=A0A8J3P4K0_9ACTN|nr:hypothetical protein [Catellatospora citrea]RKE08857.1 hypothetical protein C8E86_3731 [Catellatospora citrea]GIG01271.1 hypothetical protein Cci01nite_63640 [Catellatospora citrea]